MRGFECLNVESRESEPGRWSKKTKQKLKEVTASLIILCGFRFFPKHIIISSTWEDDWADLSCFGRYKKKKKKKIVIRSISWPAVPHCPPLLLLLQTCLYSSPSNARPSHCDGRMDGGRRRRPAPPGSGFPPPPPSFCHPAPSLTLPLPPPRPLSPLCPHPHSPFQIGLAQEWQQKEGGREREGESLWLAPFHLSRLKDQVIGFCLRIEDNCSLYSAP